MLVPVFKTSEVNQMEDGLLLQTVLGLQNGSRPRNEGGIWNSLQDLKEEVSQELLTEGPLCHGQIAGSAADEASTSCARDIEWLHRGQLEARLLAISNAQDRLLSGKYGRCVECGKQINANRLLADPAVGLCLDCQGVADGEQRFSTM
jgi:RNA polymerase-binding transcription factor DksA